MDVVVSSLNLFIFGIVSMAIGARSTSWLDRTDAGDMIVDHLSKNEEVKAMDLCPEMMEVQWVVNTWKPGLDSRLCCGIWGGGC